ncbi:MAG: glycerophosphodiester phosphodiesterase, partial [Candidatus Poseidoniales archaeon]
MPPKVISHRGRTSQKNQDNTIHSVQDAINLGIDMVEFDVRRTKDLEIICYHDEHIDGELISDLNYS